MALRKGIAHFAEVATGVTAKTLLQLQAPADQAVDISEIALQVTGVNNSHKPMKLELVRQDDAGAGSAAATIEHPAKSSESAFTLQTAAIESIETEPVETASGEVLRTWFAHPQLGMVYMAKDRDELVVEDAGRLGLRITADNSINVAGYITFEE